MIKQKKKKIERNKQIIVFKTFEVETSRPSEFMKKLDYLCNKYCNDYSMSWEVER